MLAATNAKYAGQRITVSGTISKMDLGPLASISLHERVYCSIPDEKLTGTMLKLKVGDPVRVRGRIWRHLGSPSKGPIHLRDCEVVGS